MGLVLVVQEKPPQGKKGDTGAGSWSVVGVGAHKEALKLVVPERSHWHLNVSWKKTEDAPAKQKLYKPLMCCKPMSYQITVTAEYKTQHKDLSTQLCWMGAILTLW